MHCKEKRQKEMTKKLLNEYSYVPARRHITGIFSQKMNEYMELIAFGGKEGIIVPSHNRAGASPGLRRRRRTRAVMDTIPVEGIRAFAFSKIPLDGPAPWIGQRSPMLDGFPARGQRGAPDCPERVSNTSFRASRGPSAAHLSALCRAASLSMGSQWRSRPSPCAPPAPMWRWPGTRAMRRPVRPYRNLRGSMGPLQKGGHAQRLEQEPVRPGRLHGLG